MKKILSILAALSFTASVGSTVVACGTSSSSSNNLKDGINWGSNDSVLLTLADGTKVTLGDMLNKNSSALNAYLENYVNGMVANRYTSDYANNTLNGASNLGFWNLDNTFKLQNPDAKDITSSSYIDEVNNYGMISSAMDLYRQYVQSYIDDASESLDEQYISYDYLNPSWYQTAPKGTNGRYSLWYQTKDNGPLKRWTTISETNLSSSNAGTDADASDDGGTDLYTAILHNKYLPTPDQLNGNNFFLVADDKDPNSEKIGTGWDDPITKDQKIYYGSLADLSNDFTVKASNISGQQALLLRYQAHVQSTSTSSMQNALVMEYAKNNLYKMQSAPKKNPSDLETAENKSLYIDTSSTAARDIQSWPGAGDNLVTSNYKMVWSLTVPKKQLDANADKIQSDIQALIQPRPINSKLLSKDYGLLKTQTTNVIKNAMTSLWADAKPASPAKAMQADDSTDTYNASDNLSKNGSDPYFGISGYQGIVKDGKSVDGGALNIDSAAVDKIKNVEGIGLLSNGKDTSLSSSYTFTNQADQNNNVDFIFVMPVYLMDLLRSGANTPTVSAPADNALNNIALNQWVPLNPQSSKAAWSSTSNFTGKIGSTNLPVVSNKDLPESTSLLKDKDGKWYIFIPTKDASETVSLTADGKQITLKPEVAADSSDATKDQSGYGVEGIFETTDKSKADAWKYNGQNAKYAIHLGIDNSNPDSYEKTWTNGVFQEEDVNDVANLSSSKKDDLMNTLLASLAQDSALQEETKNAIYRNYIKLNDIKYKPLYDDISKYLKEDDNTDDTN